MSIVLNKNRTDNHSGEKWSLHTIDHETTAVNLFFNFWRTSIIIVGPLTEKSALGQGEFPSLHTLHTLLLQRDEFLISVSGADYVGLLKAYIEATLTNLIFKHWL